MVTSRQLTARFCLACVTDGHLARIRAEDSSVLTVESLLPTQYLA